MRYAIEIIRRYRGAKLIDKGPHIVNISVKSGPRSTVHMHLSDILCLGHCAPEVTPG